MPEKYGKNGDMSIKKRNKREIKPKLELKIKVFGSKYCWNSCAINATEYLWTTNF